MRYPLCLPQGETHHRREESVHDTVPGRVELTSIKGILRGACYKCVGVGILHLRVGPRRAGRSTAQPVLRCLADDRAKTVYSEPAGDCADGVGVDARAARRCSGERGGALVGRRTDASSGRARGVVRYRRLRRHSRLPPQPDELKRRDLDSATAGDPVGGLGIQLSRARSANAAANRVGRTRHPRPRDLLANLSRHAAPADLTAAPRVPATRWPIMAAGRATEPGRRRRPHAPHPVVRSPPERGLPRMIRGLEK